MRIRGMTPADWPDVERIYGLGIDTGHGTFELAPPSWDAFDHARSRHLRFVAENLPGTQPSGGRVLGWAAAGPTSARRVYAGVATHSVFVDPAAHGRGIGRALLSTLADAADVGGTWSLTSGIFPENAVSRRLHAACGFRELGVQQRVGRHHGRWRDVVLVERRSDRIGADGPLVRVAGLSDGHGDDAAAVRSLLTGAGLPLDGLDDVWRTWVADADATGGAVVGCAALERHRDAFLLRSVTVDPRRRGTGLGAALVRAALRSAELELGGPATVCLLTTDAAGWFDRFGFAEVTRSDLPEAVGASAQLRGACPDSARVYLRRAAAVTA